MPLLIPKDLTCPDAHARIRPERLALLADSTIQSRGILKIHRIATVRLWCGSGYQISVPPESDARSRGN